MDDDARGTWPRSGRKASTLTLAIPSVVSAPGPRMGTNLNAPIAMDRYIALDMILKFLTNSTDMLTASGSLNALSRVEIDNDDCRNMYQSW